MICLKNCKKEIDDTNIWGDDLFNRKIVAEDFSKIITTIKQPFVISIDAPYGHGKTFFLERWRKELKKDNITVFFNAWNSDFVQNPLIPFLYNLLSQLKDQELIKKDQLKDVKQSLGIIGKDVIKTLSAGTINADEILKAQKYTTYNLSSISLDEYKEVIANIQTFKDNLASLIEEVKNKDQNIYVFVDELERCRPTYAVELLESIKHLFDIEGLVFILGIDRSQLKSTISSIYGTDMNSEGYLRKFIDLELNLPDPNRENFIQMLVEQFGIKNKKSRSSDNWINGYGDFNKYFKLFSDAYQMSLREIEQCYTEFNIITKTIPEETLLLTPLLAFLLVIKYKNQTLYNKLGNEYNDSDFIVNLLNTEVRPLINFDNYGNVLRDWDHFLTIVIACFEKNLKTQLELLAKQKNEADGDKSEITKELKLKNEALQIEQFIERYRSLYNLDIFDFIKLKFTYTSINNT